MFPRSVDRAHLARGARFALLCNLLVILFSFFFVLCLPLAATLPSLENHASPYQLMFDECPVKEKLQPCECLSDSRQIICNGSINNINTIRYIFTESSLTEVKFAHLVFSNSPLDKIVSKAFSPFNFIAITINNHYYMSTFDEDAFWPSNKNANTLKFDSNPKLGFTNESVYSLFAAVKTFPNLITLVIHRCGLAFIPPNGFGSEDIKLRNLRRVSLMNNAIKTIHANAFTSLPSVRNLHLSGNQMDCIESGAFKLNTIECKPEYTYEKPYYFVDLSNNKLSPKSLNSTSISVDCSTELNLSNNSLTYLPQPIFQPLFAHYIKIQLFGNQLDCGNCHMAWLLKGRFCPSFNSTLRYHSLVDSACDATITLKTFKKKCATFLSKQPVWTVQPPTTPLSPGTESPDIDSNAEADFLESDIDLLQCPADGPNASAQPVASATLLNTVAVLVLLATKSSLFL